MSTSVSAFLLIVLSFSAPINGDLFPHVIPSNAVTYWPPTSPPSSGSSSPSPSYKWYVVPDSSPFTQWLLERACCEPITMTSEQIALVLPKTNDGLNSCGQQVVLGASLACGKPCQDVNSLVAKACTGNREILGFNREEMGKICCPEVVFN